MKRSLLILMGLLSSVSHSCAMDQDQCNDLLANGPHGKVLIARDPKDFRVQNPRYQGTSQLHPGHPQGYFPGANYPKVPLIRPYFNYFEDLKVPFSGSLHTAYPPLGVKNIISQQLPDYRNIYSIVVQSMNNEEIDGSQLLHRLVPHYGVHPDAPAFYQGINYHTDLQWTALPGGAGHVTPAKNHQNMKLLSDPIDTHNGPGGRMLTSDNVMHLNGISYKRDQDLTSLIAFTDDQNNKIAWITYHWTLSNEKLAAFTQILPEIATLQQLILKIETLAAFQDFKGPVDELKQYVGLTPRMDRIEADLQPTGHAAKIETTPERITVITDHNANASYQLESNRFAVMVGQNIRVPYEITVEEGGKMAFGLLNTNKNGWYGEELVLQAGHHKGFYDRMVPEGEIETSLVFRNYHLGTPGQTTFTINHPIVEIDGRAEKVQINPTTNSTNVLRKNGPVKVTTDHSAEASYQLESDRFSVIPDEKIRVSYEITVEEGGKMALGLLNTNKNGWYGEELVLTVGPHKGVFERTVSEGETESSLVFRNYHLGTPGQTTFTIEDLKIEKEGKANLF